MDAAVTLKTGSVEFASPIQRIGIVPALCWLLVFSAAFWNTVDINHGENATGAERIGLDWLVAIKLTIAAGCAAVGALGVLCSPRVRQTLVSGPGLLLVALASVLVATSMFALPEVASVARAAALIFLGYLLFIPTALSVLGLRRIMWSALIAMVLNLAINWWLYLFVPSIGVFQETFGEQYWVSRMGGLGHPNAVGRTGVLCGVLSLVLLRTHGVLTNTKVRYLLFAVITISAFTVISTFSRTAGVAGIAAGGLIMSDKLCSRAGLSWMLAGLLLLLGGAFVFALIKGDEFGSSLVSMTTKTNDVEELTSATGRTDIWAEATRLILERPLTGWGLNSAPVLMEDFSRHTHNLVLHAAFSGGLIAATLVVCLLLWNLVFGLTSAEPLVRAISIYVLVSGLFEDTVIDTFSSSSTILWILVILYPATRQGSWLKTGPVTDKTSPREEPSEPKQTA